MSTSQLPFDFIICNDRFVTPTSYERHNLPLPSTPEPTDKVAFAAYEQGNVTTFCSSDSVPVDIRERPVSRQSRRTGRKERRSKSKPRPSFPEIRRYPFVLDGYPGYYTLPELSRYADIAPRRGTAMLLRRFFLVNEIIDRTQAVGYESRRGLGEVGDGSKGGVETKRNTWINHGRSKLRNELTLADLVEDEDDTDNEYSFRLSSELSFAPDLTEESFDFDDAVDVPALTSSNSDENSVNSSIELEVGDVLNVDSSYDSIKPSCSSQENSESDGGFPFPCTNVQFAAV